MPEIKHKTVPEFPYIARTYWYLRWGFLLLYLTIWIALISDYAKTLDSFKRDSWLMNLGFLIGFGILPLFGFVSMFFSKTVFNEMNIEHTSSMLIKKAWSLDLPRY
jgi:hypothetical protein